MEDLLLLLVKDASGNKHTAIRVAAQEANDFLESQQGTLRAPPHEMREKCLNAFHQALHSNNNKLMTHAVAGLQKLLRDDRFQSNFECENELQWLPSQMLQTVGVMQVYSDEVQVEILKVLLNMVCTNWWTMNSKMIQQIFQLCLDSYTEGGSAVRTAAQATASQTLRSFCNYLDEEAKCQQKNPFQQTTGENNDDILCSIIDDIIPVFNYLCKKLNEYQRVPHTKDGSPLVFLLEAMSTVVSCLPSQAKKSENVVLFLWQKFCPTLIAFLGSPRTDKNIVSSQVEGVDMGRGSGCLATAPGFTGAEAKMVYCIAVNLVELVGTVVSLRPVLESLFHRMLLYPPSQHRLEAMKALKEILKNPDLLLKFSGPIESEENKKTFSSDLALLTLSMDSVVECSRCSDNNVRYEAVCCVVAFLTTLEDFCTGNKLSSQQTEIINNLYKDLPSSDYSGPLTYRSREEEINKKNKSKIEKPTKCKREKRRSNKTSTASSSCLSDSNAEDDVGYQGDQEEDGACELECVHDDAIEEEAVVTKDGISNGHEKIDNLHEYIPVKTQETYDSDSSGSTEGPEDDDYVENENDIDDSLDEAVKKLVEKEAARREKLPKTLLGEETGKKEREQIERLCEARNEYAQLERHNSQHFARTLTKLLPQYLAIKSSIEADEALQSFASKYCDGIYNQNNALSSQNEPNLMQFTIINADGVYLATYSALLLNLKLIRNGYYKADLSTLIPLTEENFVAQVHGSGVLVYLSTIWLAELYQQVLQNNLLEDAGYNPNSTENSALINLLTGLELDEFATILYLSDIDGLGNKAPGDQLLSDYRRLEKAAFNVESSGPVKAGLKYSRRLLTACWGRVIEVLSALLTDKDSVGISTNLGILLGTDVAKEENKKAREAVALSLEGLQKAARLCNILGLQSRCGSVFQLLANASCPVLDLEPQKKKRRMANKSKKLQLHVSHALSMDVLLSRGLELGSHTPDCWRHVFRCCVYVAELEYNYFCQLMARNQTTFSKLQKRGQDCDTANIDCEDITPHQVISVSGRVNFADLIQQSSVDSSSGVITNHEFTTKIICALSYQIDHLFEDAATKLNLQSLITFLTELCATSQEQLFSESATKRSNLVIHSGLNQSRGFLLLYRLGDVMLKCVRSGRPLIHTMKAWSVVGPHFMEAACNKDGVIAKKSISCIHDVVTALLAVHSELPHFHFNEALFKPFENLLCLELCDVDIQDQIIGSICEFVEGNTTDIRSAWRPLFGTLRAVRITAPSTPPPVGVPVKNVHVQVVVDVFEAFLNTDNVLVFANAAVDCILCLLKHVRGIAEPIEGNDLSASEEVIGQNPNVHDLCLASLKYIHRCATILSSMFAMPACPIFFAANRIKLNTVPQMVDPVIPNLILIQMDPEQVSSPTHLSLVSLEATEVLMRLEQAEITLDSMDAPSGILHVWFLLLEGLAATVSTCERKYQPYTMESFFVHLRGLYDSPGSQFGVYCINHLLLPMLQSWLRRTSRIYRGWDNYASNFKQCCGLTTDLVVDYISKLADACLLKTIPGVNLMLKQLMLVMIECITQPTESISRLGCACLRHVVLSAGCWFNPELWEIACLSLHRASTVSLNSLYQLMEAFHPDSDNFYGDIGQVRVATKKDCSAQEAERLKQLAHQVTRRIPQVAIWAPEALNPALVIIEQTGVRLRILPQLPSKSLKILLDCLSVSYSASKEFDLRPGLKFLVQKVAQADVAANLYKQAGASWTIHMMTLFHLALNDKELSLEKSKALLTRKPPTPNEEAIPNTCNLTSFFLKLKQEFSALCELYVDLVLDKNGSHSHVDKIGDQPLFFLVAQPDDFPEIKQYREDGTEAAPPEVTTTEDVGKKDDDRVVNQPPITKRLSMESNDSESNNSSSENEGEENCAGSKQEDGAESEPSKVYSVATKKDIESVMEHYKRHKNQFSMPTGLREKRKNPFNSEKRRSKLTDPPLSEEIEKQRKNSIMKDSEAHIKVCSEMLLSVFDLLCQLDDGQFQALLPATYPVVCVLVAYAQEPTLRQTITEYLQRLSKLYRFIAE
uniref:SEC7 domain-containing protein n=1 Tax=Strigamia maritima TaxID=126957 RepID=T1J3I1_STRMM